MTCDCLPPPPEFDLVPPPNPQLVWKWLSEEEFEKAPDCEWSPFISISDISSNSSSPLASRTLITISLIALLFLVTLVVSIIYRIRRRRSVSAESKTSSSDAIMTCGENVWTYNSMKTSPPNAGMMYGQNSGSRIFSQATPATMRSYISGSVEPLRSSTSTTLRLHPSETCAAYHSVNPGQRIPQTEFYEEIPARGTLPPHFHIPPPPSTPPMGQQTAGRMSIRKPPPACRPPPPPSNEYSPTGSDGSLDRELQRLPSASPPCRGWEEEGRESGYGTAPSRQWRSPPSTGKGKSDESRCPTYLLPNSTSQSMTYV